MSYVYDCFSRLIDSVQASNYFDTDTTPDSIYAYIMSHEPSPVKVVLDNSNNITVPVGKMMFNPDVADVTTVNDTVTIVTFADGSQEKAVCRKGDHFSVETGVTICLMKKMLQEMCSGFGKSGTNLYNNMVKDALKKKDAFKIKKEEAAKKDKERRAEKQKLREKEKNKKRDDRDFLIDVLTEALKKNNCNCDTKKLSVKE